MSKHKKGLRGKKEQIIKELEETREHLLKMAGLCFLQSLATNDPSEGLRHEHEGRMYNNRAKLAEETIRKLKSEE